MRKLLVLHFFLLLITSSCMKEEISSFAVPVKTADQIGKHPQLTLGSVSYDFSEIQVDRPVGKIPIPILGQFISETANIFANVFVSLNNDWDVDQDEDFVSIPNMDYDIVKLIRIKSLDLKIIPDSIEQPRGLGRITSWITYRKASLDFINKINIYIQTEKMREKSEDNMIQVASYHFKKQKLGCKEKCLSFFMERDTDNKPVNLVPIIKGEDKIYIIPKLSIKKAPKRKFKIDGKIGFEVGMDLPF